MAGTRVASNGLTDAEIGKAQAERRSRFYGEADAAYERGDRDAFLDWATRWHGELHGEQSDEILKQETAREGSLAQALAVAMYG